MGIKLVIVDDAPFIREALRTIVQAAGFEFVGEAADGEEAVQVVLKKNPDIVIMDLVLPKKNGIVTIKEILEKNPAIKIIACSTETQDSMLIQAIEAGAVAFIKKPFETENVIKTINDAYKKPRS
ncbi:MAG: response regulator [Bdellovibrionota bacterium]